MRLKLQMRIPAAALLSVGAAAFSQPSPPANAQFKARLTTVPIEASTAANVTGSGSAVAALDGRILSINGTFQGMQSPATRAQVRVGPKGVRGPVEFDLIVTPAPAGTLTGTFTLSPVQMDSLKKGWFYIQIHAEAAPEGNLWGWLLP
jgi:hypothetical protein